MGILQKLEAAACSGNKQLAVLIDPDKCSAEGLTHLAEAANKAGVDYLFVGGSLITTGNLRSCTQLLKSLSNLPVVLFPGSVFQVCNQADAILLLSLISGRNSDMLIGNHVIASFSLKESGLEIIPTGYILVEGGKMTSVQYVSNTIPIPSDKEEIGVATAIAGEMLGLKLIFLEAGSGAINPVSAQMISSVKENISIPLIVGGGIRSASMASAAWEAGADLIVVGNALESNPTLLPQIGNAKLELNIKANQFKD